MNQEIYEFGTCQCGIVKFHVSGNILVNALCHCKTCCYNRGMTPIHIIVVMPYKIDITQGKELTTKYEVEDTKVTHVFCSLCGVMVYQTPKSKGYISILPTNFHIEKEGNGDGVCILPDKYMPNMHMNYRRRHYDSSDQLPKFVTWPPNDFYPDEGMCDNQGNPICNSEVNCLIDKFEDLARVEDGVSSNEDVSSNA